ncbi:MAG: hypothetical protein K2H60_11420 [Muribaculaceae bacterium]|nr:hypothetical protein [Muribaculaceae bacterium]
MAKCKYCGQSAGLFSRPHKECEEKHTRGIEGMTQLMRRYFNGNVSAVNLGTKLSRNKAPYFLTEEDIVVSSDTAIGEFTDTLRWPFNSETLPKIKGFITNLGLAYATLNKNGALDRLSLKLFQGYVIDYFAKGVPLSQISISTDSVISLLPLSQQKRDEAYYNVLNKAANKFMADGWLADNEQRMIESYTSSLGIALNCLPIQYQTKSLCRIGQAIILKDLQRGILPKKPLTVPVMLSRDEVPLWIYNNVTMLQEKITREYVGGSRGMSYRICKGLTYRTGSFKGHPVERSFMETIGVGQLVITNKNLFSIVQQLASR